MIRNLSAGNDADRSFQGWTDAGSFNCPANTNNNCNSQQKSGWDFGDLSVGASVSQYSGFNLDGWACAGDNKKRSLSPRTANDVSGLDSINGGLPASTRC